MTDNKTSQQTAQNVLLMKSAELERQAKLLLEQVALLSEQSIQLLSQAMQLSQDKETPIVNSNIKDESIEVQDFTKSLTRSHSKEMDFYTSILVHFDPRKAVVSNGIVYIRPLTIIFEYEDGTTLELLQNEVDEYWLHGIHYSCSSDSHNLVNAPINTLSIIRDRTEFNEVEINWSISKANPKAHYYTQVIERAKEDIAAFNPKRVSS